MHTSKSRDGRHGQQAVMQRVVMQGIANDELQQVVPTSTDTGPLHDVVDDSQLSFELGGPTIAVLLERYECEDGGL